MTAQTQNGVCEACHAPGQMFLWVRDIVSECTECKEIVEELEHGEIQTESARMNDLARDEELMQKIESMPQRKEEVRKEENVTKTKIVTMPSCVSTYENKTIDELEQLKARVAALERYFEENQT